MQTKFVFYFLGIPMEVIMRLILTSHSNLLDTAIIVISFFVSTINAKRRNAFKQQTHITLLWAQAVCHLCHKTTKRAYVI